MTPHGSNSAQRNGSADPMVPRLERVTFESLNGFEQDDHLEAWRVFSRTCPAIARPFSVLRAGVPADQALTALARSLEGRAEPDSRRAAGEFFKQHFQPFRILGVDGDDAAGAGFLTGYYEPLIDGSLAPTSEFSEAILQRPDDLVSFAPGETPFPSRPDISAARQFGDRLEPYPDRTAIESGAVAEHTRPVVWLRDAVEVFMVQVQGSARVRLPDGRLLRLTYAGRNGQPYSSIGRILIEEGHIRASEMSLANLKAWVRAHGQSHGEAGRAMLQRNRSYIFFEATFSLDDEEGPIGGAGVALSALRSIAVDRRIWSYGLPFWVEAEMPWRSRVASLFQRLMIAQDTGSAILGAARADVFFGSGDDAGERAGDIRHPARMSVLLPNACGNVT